MMEYIINNETSENMTILFVYNGNWEIMFNVGKTETEIQTLITRRISDLDLDFNQYGNYDSSNLLEDYTENTENNIEYGNENY